MTGEQKLWVKCGCALYRVLRLVVFGSQSEGRTRPGETWSNLKCSFCSKWGNEGKLNSQSLKVEVLCILRNSESKDQYFFFNKVISKLFYWPSKNNHPGPQSIQNEYVDCFTIYAYASTMLLATYATERSRRFPNHLSDNT